MCILSAVATDPTQQKNTLSFERVFWTNSLPLLRGITLAMLDEVYRVSVPMSSRLRARLGLNQRRAKGRRGPCRIVGV